MNQYNHAHPFVEAFTLVATSLAVGLTAGGAIQLADDTSRALAVQLGLSRRDKEALRRLVRRAVETYLARNISPIKPIYLQ